MGWIERQTETPEARRRYEEERLILWVTESICQRMEEQGLNKADLAEALGTSRANITQLLSGARNMTLRTLADLSFACGMRAEIDLDSLQVGDFVDHPVQPMEGRGRRLLVTTVEPLTEELEGGLMPVAGPTENELGLAA